MLIRRPEEDIRSLRAEIKACAGCLAGETSTGNQTPVSMIVQQSSPLSHPCSPAALFFYGSSFIPLSLFVPTRISINSLDHRWFLYKSHRDEAAYPRDWPPDRKCLLVNHKAIKVINNCWKGVRLFLQ